jgi:hypothetical protein
VRQDQSMKLLHLGVAGRLLLREEGGGNYLHKFAAYPCLTP